MKKLNIVASVMIICLSAFMLKSCSKTSGTSEVKLTVLTSMDRIGQDQAIYGETQAVIKAAKNEVESFQIVVGAVRKSFRVIKVEISDLTGSSGTIGKENVTLFREEYVRVRRPSPRAQLPPGLYTDPLVPFINPQTGQPIEPWNQYRKVWGQPMISSGFDMYAVPFDVWKGQNQPVWVDVSIPKNAVAGDYKGTVTVTMDNVLLPWGQKADTLLTRVVSIPVTVTVWNFSLPDGPTHKNDFGGVGRVASLFGVEPNSDKAREIEMRYCQMMSDHRINPPIPINLLPEVSDDGSLKITPERHEALKNFIEDLHVTDFVIPRAPIKDMIKEGREKAIKYYRDYYKYVKENGWDKRAYVYMYDEPNLGENYEEVLALGAMIHEAAPQLRCLVVEQTFTDNPSWPNIDPAVDIWCPLFAFIDRETIDEKLANGDEVWSYTALAQRAPQEHPHYDELKNYDSPYWHIDAPLTSYRSPTWMNWQYKITGLLYWSTVTRVKDTWNLPAYAEGGFHFNGGGYLIYPGVPCGIDGPISCMRLKTIRDSMEDYEYFVLLEKLAGREAVTKFVSAVAPDWWATTEDPKMILSTREKIAEEILKLTK